MSEEENVVRRPYSRDHLIWGAIVAALLSSGTSGVLSVVNTEDRYYGRDAARDFAVRDERVAQLRRDIGRIDQELLTLDTEHPPEWIIEKLADYENRLRALEIAP